MGHKFTVEDLKLRLDKYLAGQLPGISRSQIQRDIEAGAVLVNGRTVRENKFTVHKDDKVEYQKSGIRNQKLKIKAENRSLRVLYDNHGLLIIDKPAGMAVHPGAGFKGNTLASALLYHFKDIGHVGEKHRPGIVHRLDKDTSGAMLVAKTPEMYEHLKDAFSERKIKKEYIALVVGRLEKRHGFIETPIGKSKRDFRKQDVKDVLQAKLSLTEYRVLEYLSPSPQPSPVQGEGENPSPRAGEGGQPVLRSLSEGGRPDEGGKVDCYTLVHVKLHTGRTHQIRVHFNSIGHPLAGDALYGGKKSKIDGLARQFLHAKKIEVRLPFGSEPQGRGPDGTWIEAMSDLPVDLKKVLISLDSKRVSNL